MITNKMKLKKRQKIFHVIINRNSIVRHVIQFKNGIIKHVNINLKIILRAKKIIVGALGYVFVRIVTT